MEDLSTLTPPPPLPHPISPRPQSKPEKGSTEEVQLDENKSRLLKKIFQQQNNSDQLLKKQSKHISIHTKTEKNIPVTLKPTETVEEKESAA